MRFPYLPLLSLSILVSLFGPSVFAEEPAPGPRHAQPTPSTVPAAPPASGKAIPNQRELTQEDYAWLGSVVWKQMQLSADPQKRDLSVDDVKSLEAQMERNRSEVNITLPDLYTLMKSPALCNMHSREWGFDTDKPLGPQLDHIFH